MPNLITPSSVSTTLTNLSEPGLQAEGQHGRGLPVSETVDQWPFLEIQSAAQAALMPVAAPERGVQTNPSAFCAAVDLLSFSPAFQQHMGCAVEAFSSTTGSARTAEALNQRLTDCPHDGALSGRLDGRAIDPRGDHRLRARAAGPVDGNRGGTDANRCHLAGVFRHWGAPPPDQVAMRHQMTVATPNGADGYQWGAVSMLVSPGLGQGEFIGKRLTGMWARVYAGRTDWSPAGLWHGRLMSLAQDLYLKGLLAEVPLVQLKRPGVKLQSWPTVVVPSLMRLVHGVGIPVMEVNGQQRAVGLADDPQTALLPLECSLFAHSLLRQASSPSEGWGAEDLNAVFTPALADWVLQMRAAGVFEGKADSSHDAFALPPVFRNQWFSFLWNTAARQSRPADEISAELGVELQRVARMARSSGHAVTHEQWVQACPLLVELLEGLCRLQDRVRYGGGQLTALPLAGPERAWLNSQLRNLMCMALGLVAPAEVAQFDLLLRAMRERNNQGFNDHSVNQALVDHLEWVAQTQAGHDTLICKAMRYWRDALIESSPRHTDPCVFWLDEHSRATAGG